MRSMTQILMIVLLLAGSTGCSYLFWPRAADYRTQAKGVTGIETMVNLPNMMEASAKAAKGGKGLDNPLDDFHNQFHALYDSFCDVTKEQADTPAYDLAYTHKKELSAIFRRLWKFKNDQPQRDQHLDLMVAELQELRATLQTIK